jgi:hypothetical protein
MRPKFKPNYSITPQRIVCAANRNRKSGRIICGARHWDNIMRSQKREDENWTGWDEGFIDQFGQFLNREEAWLSAQEQGQIRCEVSSPGTLYSENLY